MKRTAVLLLLLSLLLCACASKEERVFYYCPADYLTDTPQVIPQGESRTVAGYEHNIPFLVSLYLTGPLDSDLVSPFPAGTRLLSAKLEEGHLTIQLQEMPRSISDGEFSLACACLSMTCLELTEAESVTVSCGNRSITMDASLLILQDTPPLPETTNGGTP